MKELWKRNIPTLVWALLVVGACVDAALWANYYQIFDTKLGVTLVIVEIPIALIAGFIISTIFNESRKHAKEIGEEVGKQLEKVQNKDDGFNKENHAKELNEKIFKRLSTISMREDKYHNYGLYVKKNDALDDPRFANIIYSITDDTVIPLDKLPNVYYEWALKHLEHEEYSDKILKPFNQLQEWIKQYDETETIQRNMLEEQIDKVV